MIEGIKKTPFGVFLDQTWLRLGSAKSSASLPVQEFLDLVVCAGVLAASKLALVGFDIRRGALTGVTVCQTSSIVFCTGNEAAIGKLVGLNRVWDFDGHF